MEYSLECCSLYRRSGEMRCRLKKLTDHTVKDILRKTIFIFAMCARIFGMHCLKYQGFLYFGFRFSRRIYAAAFLYALKLKKIVRKEELYVSEICPSTA